jgi:hypothetical protein
MQTTKMKVSDHSGFFSQWHATAKLSFVRLQERFEAAAGDVRCGDLTVSPDLLDTRTLAAAQVTLETRTIP